MLYPQNGDRTMAIDFVTSLHPIYSETSHWMKFYTARSLIDARIGNEKKCANTIGTVLVSWAGYFQC